MQAYVRRVREACGSVSSRFVIYCWSKGHSSGMQSFAFVQLRRASCAKLIVGMLSFGKDEVCTEERPTAKSKHSVQHFDRLRKDFLQELKAMVAIKEVPAQPIMNWDQN